MILGRHRLKFSCFSRGICTPSPKGGLPILRLMAISCPVNSSPRFQFSLLDFKADVEVETPRNLITRQKYRALARESLSANMYRYLVIKRYILKCVSVLKITLCFYFHWYNLDISSQCATPAILRSPMNRAVKFL